MKKVWCKNLWRKNVACPLQPIIQMHIFLVVNSKNTYVVSSFIARLNENQVNDDLQKLTLNFRLACKFTGQ